MPKSANDIHSRRDIGRLLAFLGAAPPFTSAQERGSSQPFPPDEQSEIDAKFNSIVRKYGDRLSGEQRTRIREVLARHERMLHGVRAFPLENSDAAATGLRLYPTDTLRKKE